MDSDWDRRLKENEWANAVLLFGLVFRNDWFSSRDWHIEAEFRPRYRSVPPVPDTLTLRSLISVYRSTTTYCVFPLNLLSLLATNNAHICTMQTCTIATYRVHDCQCRYSVGPLANHQPDSQDRTEPILRAGVGVKPTTNDIGSCPSSVL